METRRASSERAANSSGSRTRSKRALEREPPVVPAPPKRAKSGGGSSSNRKRKSQATTNMSDRPDSASGARSSAAPTAGSSSANAAAAGGSAGSSSGSSAGEPPRRATALDEAEQEALDRLEESAANAQSWGAPSNALHGLLRKLGAGLDDLLPSMSASHSKLKVILTGLKADDDGRQLASLNELCELLSIGTEESMSAMSVDVFVPLLVQLLRKEHNADIMLLASRAMCHMMDVLPSSPAALVHYDAVPLFCERLLSIEYIDLAEQALQALEKLSHEHPLAILRAGGMVAVLQYVDFFATGVQRIAVSTAANMCRGLPVECAHLVADAVPQLTGLLSHHDQKVLEHVCLAFARLVDDFAHAPPKLEMLAAHGLLPALLTLISSMVPSGAASVDVTLSASTCTMLLRTLATLSRGSPTLSHQLLQQGVAFKLREILLTDESLASGVGAPVSRPHDQLHQILSLCNELLPALPKTAAGGGSPWRGSSASKRRSRRTGDDDDGVEQSAAATSEREKMLSEDPQLLSDYASALFPVLLQVHSAAANAAVRQKCLSCISKVVHFHSPGGLEDLLRELPFASFIASLFSSHETPQQGFIALGIAETLYDKMPHIYADRFLREGVFHAVSALAAACPDDASAVSTSAAAASSAAVAAPRRLSRSSSGGSAEAAAGAATASGSAAAAAAGSRTRAGGRGGEPQPPSAPPAPKPADNGSTVLIARAVKFREVFVASDATLADSLTAGLGSPTLVKLRSLAARMCDASVYSTLNPLVNIGAAPLLSHSDIAALRDVAVLLTERDGISTFEFAQSGLVDAILKYLNADAEADLGSNDSAAAVGTERRSFRLRAFCHLFLGTPPPSPPASPVDSTGKKSTRSASRVSAAPSLPPPPPAEAAAAAAAAGTGGALFKQLVGKLQDAINMIETFPMLLTEGTSSDTSTAGLKALTQPFKLRLQRAAGTSSSLKEYASNVVLIEPLASVAAIEDFLWPKVRRDVSLRQMLRDSAPPPAAESSVAPAAAVSGSSAAAAASSGSGSTAGSAGKLPVRGDDSGGASGKASKGRSGEEGLFRADEDDAEMGGEEGEEEEDDDEEDDDEGDDQMFSSAGLASSLDSNAECVHDLELSSPPRGSAARGVPSLAAAVGPSAVEPTARLRYAARCCAALPAAVPRCLRPRRAARCLLALSTSIAQP